MGEIYLGTSGFSFQDWKGTVYPTHLRNSEMFDYYISQFRLNSVEINYTYYRMPSAKTFSTFERKVPSDFDFTVKLFSGITHDPWIKFKTGEVDTDLCKQFLEGIYPLAESGKLGCLLAQFPVHMQPGDKAWSYMLSLRDAFSSQKLVYEFRNKKWLSKQTFSVLKAEGIGYCAVDEPHIGPLMPLVPVVTSDIAYLRLHGRSDKWFTDEKLRYDYYYSENELKKFVPIVKSMADKSMKTYVQFNNCHAGSALRNVKMMQFLLGIDLPPVQGILF